MKKNTVFLTESALIGAFYAVLTMVGSLVMPELTFGPIQIRFSEVLTVLPLLTPAAIPGLFVGCIISNAVGLAAGANVAGALDILFGSLATLLAAVLTYAFRSVRIKGLPWLSLMPPVVLNALVVGTELAFFLPEVYSYSFAFLSVGLSELVMVVVLGVPLYYLLRRTKLFAGK